MGTFAEIADERRALADLVPKGALEGLRLEACDIDRAHGSGPTVRGSPRHSSRR